MPTPIELTLLGIIVAITIPGISGYGKLKDEIATMRAKILSLEAQDTRNAADIAHEARRNDAQDTSLSTIRETLSRIDTNVQRLLEDSKESGRRNFSQ